MNRNPFARVIAILLLGMLFASYTNHDQQKWRRLGRMRLSHTSWRDSIGLLRDRSRLS
jgi:hypothetical protein